MYLSKIKLTNFRNYTLQEVEFSKGINIIYGENAQGKTNLLEALYLFTAGKSFRTQNDTELIKFGSDFAKAEIEFFLNGRENNAEIIFSSKRKKLIKLNGLPLKRTGELLGVFRAVLFCPEELSLVSGSPEIRRKFLDMYISSQKPKYYGILKSYNKILKQKNSLLKNGADSEMLEIWHLKLAEEGAKIIIYRDASLKKISEKAKEVQKEISEGNEQLEIKYSPTSGINPEQEEEKIKNDLLKAMKKRELSEAAQGISLVGPHRDDMIFYINGKQARSFASQGQQRTAVIAVKTAQTELIKEETGEYPVLLLDDIMSELDSKRQQLVTEKIKNMQIFITCTSKETFKEFENGKFFEISEGRLI